MQTEVTIIIKNEDSTFRKKFVEYRTLSASENDPVLCELIEQAKAEFNGEAQDLSFKIEGYFW